MVRTILYARLQLWCVVALILTLPSNLFFSLTDSGAYVQGLRIDYLIPKLYLSDIFILGILASWVRSWWTQRHTAPSKEHTSQRTIAWVTTAFLLVQLIMAQLVVTPRPFATLWFICKLLEYTALFAWLITHRSVLHHALVKSALIAMLIFQSVLGLLQFTRQQSIFPSYLWLGETRLQQYAGISKGSFGGVERILPYGTTAHSNILAGVLAVGVVYCLLVFLRESSQHRKWCSLAASALCFSVLCLTQSFSAMLAVLFGIWLIWLTQQRKTLSLRHVAWLMALSVIGTPIALQLMSEHTMSASITRRAWLNQAAIELLLQSPLTGIGLNTFTAHVEQVMPSTEVIRFVQPVHHVPLLILSELGLLGVVLAGILGWIWWQARKSRHVQKPVAAAYGILLPFLPLLVLDHYLWTNQAGQLLWMVGGIMLLNLLSAPKRA